MTTMLIIGIGVFAVVLFLSFRRNRRKAFNVGPNIADKNAEHTSHVAYGITNGEYVICSNCKHHNRVGVGFDQPQIQCEGCGEIIVLRGNDAERRHGEVLDAEFNRFDMKDSR